MTSGTKKYHGTRHVTCFSLISGCVLRTSLYQILSRRIGTKSPRVKSSYNPFAGSKLRPTCTTRSVIVFLHLHPTINTHHHPTYQPLNLKYINLVYNHPDEESVLFCFFVFLFPSPSCFRLSRNELRDETSLPPRARNME